MAKAKGNSEHASKARKKRQDAQRSELRYRYYLGIVHRTLREDWIQPVMDAKGKPVLDAQGNPQTINKAAEYKGKADIAMRMVNKFLPDLKAVEHSGQVAVTPLGAVLREMEEGVPDYRPPTLVNNGNGATRH